jgi:hypothetical protein
MVGRKPLGAIFSVLVLSVLMVPTRSAAFSPPAPVDTAGRQAAATVPAACLRQSTHKFWPKRAKVQHVGKRVPVLWMGEYSNGIPKSPPLTTSGKNSFGWDKKGPKPGAHHGNVRFFAHTYPDGSALGNRLLAHLWVGQRIILKSSTGDVMCYKVTKRIVVTPRSYAARVGYYRTTGKPKLAIVACSPPRLGPGNGKYRTIWYAKPSTT